MATRKGPDDGWMALDVETDKIIMVDFCLSREECLRVIDIDSRCGNLNPTKSYRPEKVHIKRGWEGKKNGK